MADSNDLCRIHVICIATNPYGRSEKHFTLLLNTIECYVIPSISPIPSITWVYTSMTTYVNNSSAMDVSPTDLVNSIHYSNELPIIGAILGAVMCLVMALAILVIALCFCKGIYFKHK